MWTGVSIYAVCFNLITLNISWKVPVVEYPEVAKTYEGSHLDQERRNFIIKKIALYAVIVTITVIFFYVGTPVT